MTGGWTDEMTGCALHAGTSDEASTPETPNKKPKQKGGECKWRM